MKPHRVIRLGSSGASAEKAASGPESGSIGTLDTVLDFETPLQVLPSQTTIPRSELPVITFAPDDLVLERDDAPLALDGPRGPGWIARSKASGARWWRRSAFVTAIAVVAIIGVVATLLVVSTGKSAAKQYKVSFPVESFPEAGVTLSRTWTLYGGTHPTLHADLVFYSTRSSATQVQELLPTSLVTQASKVSFTPQPTVVSNDPVVVSYTVASADSGVTSASYDVPITQQDLSMVVLNKWAAQQGQQSGDLYRASHTLASVQLSPSSIVLKKGGRPYQLRITGLLADGSTAPTVAFGGTQYTVANPKIAKVSPEGAVTPLAVGRTTVRATLGQLSGTASVIVSAAANVKPTPQVSPSSITPAAQNLPLFGSAIPSAIASPAVNHTRKTTKPPVTIVHTPVPPPVVPPVVPPGPVCTSPPAPTGVSAAQSGVGAVTVTWSAPGASAGCSLVGYTVTGTDASGNNLAAGTPAGGLSATFSGLPVGNTSFDVTANYSSISSGASPATVTIVPPCDVTALGAPSGLFSTPSSTTPGEVSVGWGAAPSPPNCPAVSGYSYSVDSGGLVSAGGLSADLTGLDPAVSHTLSVVSFYPNGDQFASALLTFSAPELCSDGVTVAVAASCPAPPPPPPPPGP